MIAGHIVLALVFVCVVLDVITSCCVFTTDAVWACENQVSSTDWWTFFSLVI